MKQEASNSKEVQELSNLLDKLKVPHTDIAIPGNVHSGRYVVTQWQRLAAGATISVLAYNKSGELCVAMGVQRGELNLPAGYTEGKLPKDNLTDIPPSSSRKKGKETGFVDADEDIGATAVREAREELGITVSEKDLVILGEWSKQKHHPMGIHTVNTAFAVILPEPAENYKLQVTDFEFVDDDLSKPHWIKVRDIIPGERFTVKGLKDKDGNPIPIRDINVEMLEKAVPLANNKRIAEISGGVFKDQEAVLCRYNQKLVKLIGHENAATVMQKEFGNKPNSALGEEGIAYQAKIYKKAQDLTTRAITPKGVNKEPLVNGIV